MVSGHRRDEDVTVRPLKPDIAGPTDRAPVETLTAARGAYCAICERPLISTGFVWSAALGQTVSAQRRGAADRSLLLCVNCEHDQAAHEPVDPDTLALPLDDTTFALDDSSQIVYEEVDRTLDFIDEAGKGDVESARLVVVRATTERAHRTAELFGLDFGSADETPISVLRTEWLSWDDPRARLRTDAWNAAHTIGHRLTEETIIVLDLLAARNLISRLGFASVWATVLRNYLDIETIGQLLGAFDVPGSDELPALAATSRDPFPGTDWNRFFGSTRPQGLQQPSPA